MQDNQRQRAIARKPDNKREMFKVRKSEADDKARKPVNQETEVEGSALTEQSIQLQPMKYNKLININHIP